MRPTSDKQRRFVEEYLVDCNATQAAIRSGYSAKTAQEQGSRLLSNVMVAAAIAEAQKARSERTEIKADRVLLELARIGFSNMLDYIRIGPDGLPYTDFSALTREQAAAIQEVHVETTPAVRDDSGEQTRPEVKKIRLKLADKRAALVELGKHLGIFKERVDVGLNDPIQQLYAQFGGRVFRPREDN